jgi:ribosomal-protein-alanine N-acetyltransferase
VIEIAAATHADVDSLLVIEQQAFPTSSPEQDWRTELDRSQARLNVARSRGQVVAYCNYWIVAAELHVHAIATLPNERGQGIAFALLNHAMCAAAAEGCGVAILEVRASNTAAIRLYQRAGFSVLYIRSHYYRDTDEDALVMSRQL